jgi:hypothetical protein
MIQYGIRNAFGSVFECNSEEQVRTFMRSTSIFIGPMDVREMVRREVPEWEVFE